MAIEMALPAFDTTDYLAGDQYFRPNRLRSIGDEVPEHDHNHPHAALFVAGWGLLRLYDAAGDLESEWQLAAPEHQKLRDVGATRRPIRLPDHRIVGIDRDQPIPEGGREIPFRPIGYWGEVLPRRRHSIVALADHSAFCCTYSFRDPNAGGKVIVWNGNMHAVE